MQDSLHNAATTQDYQAYMCHKHNWTPKDCNNINWWSIKLALQQFEKNDRQRLQKFLHDNWLPLRASKHATWPASDCTCLICCQTPETYWHFLKCQHPAQAEAYQQLQKVTQQHHETHNIDPHMLQLIWQGINAIHKQYPIDEQLESYPEEFKPLFEAQCRIGWEQLFYSHLPQSWAYYVDHSSHYKTNGMIFYSQVIVHIWKYILSIWTIWNSALHPANPTQQTRQLLAPQVQHLFQLVENEPATQGHKPNSTPEQILQLQVRSIRQFLTTGYWQFCWHATAAWTQAITHTRDIWSYFRRRTSTIGETHSYPKCESFIPPRGI